MSEPYYADDLVTLYHGDCREVTAWLEADVLVPDPPYGVRWGRRFGDARLGTKGRSTQPNAVEGDRDTSARDEVLAMWGYRPAIVFGSWRVLRPTETRSLLIWHKEGSYSGPANAAFFTNHEEIYVLGDGEWRRSSPPLRSVITTTETRHHEPARTGHPTSKPVPLMATLLDRCPSGIVADPFAGSGSTLVAAKQLGRRAVGVEIDERYCEVAARRLAQDALFEVTA